MFQELINLVRQSAGDNVLSIPAVPKEKNEEVISTASDSIMDTLKSALAGGKLKDVMGYFKKGPTASPELVQEATNKFAQELQDKMGLEPSQAGKAAAELIPRAMDQFARQTSDPSDSKFNIQDIFNKLSGNKTGSLDIQGLFNRFGKGKFDKDSDGDIDLKDLKSMFAGEGGMVERVKGLFN